MKNPGDVLSATFASFSEKLSARAAAEMDNGPERFVVPRRAAIYTGQVPFDCAQLAVSALQLYPGSPGQRLSGYQVGTGGVALYSVDLGVTLVREAPTLDTAGRTPSADTLTASARQTAYDASVLTDAFWAAWVDNSIAGECDFVYFGGVDWLTPAGGLTGTMLNLSVQL